MTRRIAMAILLTVWAMLIAGGLVAYIVTRSVLLDDFDHSMIARVRARPELKDRPEALPRIEESAEDRMLIDNLVGPNLRLPQVLPDDDRGPTVISRGFVRLGSGRRYRTLSLRFSPAHRGGKPALVVYSSPTDRLDSILNRLAISLAAFGAAAGLAAAGVAVAVSRKALRPLSRTAQVIGEIDDLHLDRRIDSDALPIELRPVAGKLNEMLGRIEQSSLQRKQFLADASHELRTPVAALVTTLEVALRRPREAPAYIEALETCLSDARMLRQLVQTLLEHARSGVIKEELEPFDAAALMNQCADVAEGLAVQAHVQIARNIPPALPVKTFPNRLRGIVMNLMGNAVEHNRPGGRVEIHCEAQGADLEVAITDTGPGIAAEHIPHLFEPFYRVSHGEDSFNARQHLGLGLFLVDSHIKSLGGTCRIESEVGVGTTFRVRVPGICTMRPTALEASVA